MRPTQAECATLCELLQMRAHAQPDDRAYVFLNDRGDETAVLTFAQLHRKASAVAARLAESRQTGARALLLFPPGLGFLVAYFGCLYAGIVAVPVIPPRRNRVRESTLSITRDCTPDFVLTVSALLSMEHSEFGQATAYLGMRWLAVDAVSDELESTCSISPGTPDQLAFLQYTSGSTSAPKGIMVSHGNLLANLEMARAAFGNDRTSNYLSWIPLFHDMGLILVVLQTLYLGALCVLMAPPAFVQRPLSWLRAIHRYQAKVAGAPNFAYDLCVAKLEPSEVADMHLGHWEVAFNGAEPVREETIRRFIDAFAPYGFRPEAFYPCYGMAEATVLISAGSRAALPVMQTVSKQGLRQHRVVAPADRQDCQTVVGCGRELAGEQLLIVNPDTHCPCGVDEVGEIWVAGAHVAGGYWQQGAATAETFQAHIADTQGGPFLRTGDLGFMDATGELYITGRIKDIIIVRGANFYPQDIEKMVEDCHPGLRKNCGAAFTVTGDDGVERLVIVQEVERSYRHHHDVAATVAAIRKAIVSEYELMVHTVVLIRPGTIPKTSSGKIQRRATKQRYLEGRLQIWDGQQERLRFA